MSISVDSLHVCPVGAGSWGNFFTVGMGTVEMILCLSQASRRSESNPWIIFLSWLLMSCRVVRFRISKASSTFSRVSDGSNDLLMIVKKEKEKVLRKGKKKKYPKQKSKEEKTKKSKSVRKKNLTSIFPSLHCPLFPPQRWYLSPPCFSNLIRQLRIFSTFFSQPQNCEFPTFF